MAPFWKRLTQPIPNRSGKEVIWIHGVSVGEIKSAQPLFLKFRAAHPEAFFLVTTTTTTGQAEAKRSLPGADAICYLPIDFPWVVSKWARKLRPKLFLLIESDFWPFLLRAIRKRGGKNILVSGKLSEKSASRFRRLSFFSKPLFNLFDLLLVQNEEHRARLAPLVSHPNRLQIGGNLKFDLLPQTIDIESWRRKIGSPKNAIAITCTHPNEEEALLDQLETTDHFIFLAPRHPERFESVAELLQRKKIHFYRFSRLDERRGGERVLLIDAMGKLPICYSLSQLAVVGGSFVPIGGHNILEPCLYHLPVLFGPHMETQTELVSLILKTKGGFQVELKEVRSAIQVLLSDIGAFSEAATRATKENRGVGEKAFLAVEKELKMEKIWQ